MLQKKLQDENKKNNRFIESRLLDFLVRVEYLFTNFTRNVIATALVYKKGILLCGCRNCQMMAEELQEANQQRLHHFISQSKWDFQRLMDVVTIQFWQRLQDLELTEDICLIIDEAGNPPKKWALCQC